ncbi:MAG: DUF2141 domain-containing protein [Sphingomonas sp.]|nr:DUF2141 domain-containing protein [Sphingomonas sp.]
MSKSRIALLASLLALATAAPAGVVGPDARACVSGKPSMLVRVNGFRKPSGSVKVAVYAAEGYLAKGGKLRKVEVPVRSRAPMDICIAVPRAGRYAVAVHHDVNGNGDKDISDGGGYSGNPKLSIANLRPPFGQTAIQVGAAPRAVSVTLLYRIGLSLKPANS